VGNYSYDAKARKDKKLLGNKAETQKNGEKFGCYKKNSYLCSPKEKPVLSK